MIRVAVEVREDTALSRMVVRARSISHALDIAQGGLAEREVRVVFPIDAEGFFEPGRGGGGDGDNESDILGDHTLAGGHREEGGVRERRLARRGDAD